MQIWISRYCYAMLDQHLLNYLLMPVAGLRTKRLEFLHHFIRQAYNVFLSGSTLLYFEQPRKRFHDTMCAH
jgi:hypothetical protein